MADRNEIEIRLLGLEDGAAVTRLAELDTTDPPPSPLLGAIVEGRLVAAHSLANAASIADPFRPTAELLSMLAERARQMNPNQGGGLLSRLRQRTGGITRPGAASGVVR
jgi:hypothetical protein